MTVADVAYDLFLITAIMIVGAASTVGFYSLVAFLQLRYSVWRNSKR